jgi:hypothetical protein
MRHFNPGGSGRCVSCPFREYRRVLPPRCGKKRGAFILSDGLHRLCIVSQSTRTVWTLEGRRLGEIGASVFPWQRLISPSKTPSHSKLLYTWHNRKERLRSIPWGLVAPMQLNLWSRSQREAVHQTVRAHCNTYDLHLVALVISHDSKSPRSTTPSFLNASDTTEPTDVPPDSDSDIDEDSWRTSVLDEVIEPVLMACDYKTLLAEASGRVIILSNSAEGRCDGISPWSMPNAYETGSPLASLSLTSRKAAAESLAVVLESHGIRVSSIYFGPLAQDSTRLSPERPSVRRYVGIFLGSLVLLKVKHTRSNRRLSRRFGTCAGLQLHDIF